jgi:hypothetical protein
MNNMHIKFRSGFPNSILLPMKAPSSFRVALSILLAGIFILSGCRKDQPDGPASGRTAEVVLSWYQHSLKLTKEGPGFTPPVAARAFGYTGVALWEAIVPGRSGARSLQGQINGLSTGSLPVAAGNETYHWDLVANAALATSLRRYYPNASQANRQAIDEMEETFYQRFAAEVSPEVALRSRSFGRDLAEAVYQFALTDGRDQCYMENFPDGYVPPSGPGFWVPTPPAYQKALQPFWGDTRPFMISNVILPLPPGTPPYSETPGSLFYLEGLEVYTVTTNMSAEQKTIAEFWSDDPGLTATPPGHSINIVLQVLEKENADLWEAAELLARAGMCVHDAFVSCWRTKYLTNVLRPVTYVQKVFDASWMPLLNTPPFPEYTSGHSVQSGAIAALLTSKYGDGYAFTDRTHVHRTDINGAPRHFPSFNAMAQEAAISRLYGGIHYKAAIEHGNTQGRKIGEHILLLRMLE